ncbi:hypothetical protein [Vreelandella rituensis]|uniref:Uncharacterized protein n=1 Tax=Vreelandella rituensis TaxID=2282306 RepID=A0A368TXU9_9GAMM|nr:hypothetical protein [Halomonas rituensis]RCV89595.1 hypothetical protein DU506_12550 [Halomonas rituensis]
MPVRRVERIMIRPGHANYLACHRYCSAARKVANATLYHMRQALFAEAPISASQADKLLKKEHKDVYQLLPSAGGATDDADSRRRLEGLARGER